MKALLLVVSICFCLSTSSAQNRKPNEQARPNFSGTWELSPSESKLPGFDFKLSQYAVTEIDHREPVLGIIEKAKDGGEDVFTTELVYYTDGRGETNVRGTKTRPSKTKWEGRKLVTKVTGEDTKIEWELSPDGNKLTRKIIVKTSVTVRGLGLEGERTLTNKSEVKLVYVRASGSP